MYHIFPFPSIHNGQAIVVNLTFIYYLYSDIYQHKAHTNDLAIRDCKFTSHVRDCLPSTFLLRPPDNELCRWEITN